MTVKSVHAKLIGHAHKDIGKDHAASASNTTLLVQRIDVFQRQQALGDGAGSSAPAAICRGALSKDKQARSQKAGSASFSDQLCARTDGYRQS